MRCILRNKGAVLMSSRNMSVRAGSALMFSLWSVLAMAFSSGPTRAQGPDKIAATVNGEAITEAAFYERLQFARAQEFIVSINPPVLKAEPAGQLILNAMINERLLL